MLRDSPELLNSFRPINPSIHLSSLSVSSADSFVKSFNLPLFLPPSLCYPLLLLQSGFLTLARHSVDEVYEIKLAFKTHNFCNVFPIKS